MSGFERSVLALLWAFAGLVAVALYGPVLLVVLRSLIPAPDGGVDPHAFTTVWYVTLFRDSGIGAALGASLIVGASAVSLSVALALVVAYFLKTGHRRGRALLEGVILLPFVLPAIITGLSLLLWLREMGLQTGLGAAILGHVILILPVAFRLISDRLSALEISQIEASLDLGAGHMTTFFRVVAPQLAPSILMAGLLGFALSFDETLVSFFLVGSEMTLPIRLWSMLRTGLTPEINAFATMALLATTAIAVVAGLNLRPRKAR